MIFKISKGSVTITSVGQKSANSVIIGDALDQKVPEGLVGLIFSNNILSSNGGNGGISLRGFDSLAGSDNWRTFKQLKGSDTSKSKKRFEHGEPNRPAGLLNQIAQLDRRISEQ